jgi:hypothetical protein
MESYRIDRGYAEDEGDLKLPMAASMQKAGDAIQGKKRQLSAPLDDFTFARMLRFPGA